MPSSTQQQQQQDDDDNNASQNEQQKKDSESESESDSESEYDSDSDSESEYDSNGDPKEKKTRKPESYYTRPGEFMDIPESDNSPEANIERFTRALNSRRNRRAAEEDERRFVYPEEQFDFPKDRENWREADLRELWADAPLAATKPGWDPVWADEDDWQVVEDELRQGKDPPIAPFYLPYRKPYPVIPDNHYDISNPKAVVEELDRIEEFLKWVSYIFADGSSYEGTVWDDLAHGKGVYVAEQGLVRYEGEWLQNNMEGHGVVEVDIPDIEPIPGSKLEAQMRAEGKIITRDFMNPEDREWLEMDIEDSVRLTGGNYEIPFYENDEWIRQFGRKPEKGRYRYAGQWKHSRMHGCGVYEVNEQPIFGRFYFGELVEEATDCDEKTSTLHAGIAEVAAAKARMFVNKPDGMVREERGPYGDPQHPYFYEEDDVWQAPGFINQFYEVPDYWKTYAHEVDEEREMWLNSFYKAPLRLPMPAELEHWWERDTSPEFVLLNKEPEPDPNDPSKLIYSEDPVILHTPTGRIINYVDDEEHGIRLFWQPPLKEGEDVDPSKVEFLPLGFDEFYGREVVAPKEGFLKRLVCSIENTLKPWFDKLEKWTEEQKKASKIRRELLEQELELIEAELTLEEILEDMEEALKQEEKDAEKKADIDLEEDDVIVEQEEKVPPPKEREDVEEDEEGEGEEEDEDDLAPSSFGTVIDTGSSKDKKNEPGKSPFSTLSIASSGLLSMVPSLLERSFCMWKKERCPPKVQTPSVISQDRIKTINRPESLTFCQPFPENLSLTMKSPTNRKFRAKQPVRKSASASKISPSSCQSTCAKDRHKGQKLSRLHWLHNSPETYFDIILSLNIPVQSLSLST
ncbi:protein TIC 100 [Silene latifolia]|uniref:protein TIC 100 n=1 Tax=Silene latifolia TaxID=37657 RepID=UPI003D772E93